jgi:Ca2+-binding EF-hand superfamily protein
VYTKADTDADGKLSLDELKTLLVPPAPKPEENPEVPTEPVTPPKDNATETTPADPAKNETITPTEPVKNETEANTPANVIPSNATETQVKEFFEAADTDKDMLLSKEEIKAAFFAQGETLTDAELDAGFTKADTDADGKLSLQELTTFMVPAEPETPPTDPVTPGDNTNETTKNETQPEDPKPVDPETQPANVLPSNATD